MPDLRVVKDEQLPVRMSTLTGCKSTTSRSGSGQSEYGLGAERAERVRAGRPQEDGQVQGRGRHLPRERDLDYSSRSAESPASSTRPSNTRAAGGLVQPDDLKGAFTATKVEEGGKHAGRAGGSGQAAGLEVVPRHREHSQIVQVANGMRIGGGFASSGGDLTPSTLSPTGCGN